MERDKETRRKGKRKKWREEVRMRRREKDDLPFMFPLELENIY